MELLKECVTAEIRNPIMNVGRLLVYQCPRKLAKYKKTYPTFKTTRPIAVTGIYQKMIEHILLRRIKGIIIEETSDENAGFKPRM